MEGLPHFQLTIDLNWDWTLKNPSATPNFTISDVTMCVGRILGHLLHDVVEEAQSVLQPLNDVIGPDGFLLKPVPATQFIFGHTLNVAEFIQVIAQDFCSGKCQFTNVWEAIETFIQIYDDIESFVQIVAMDPDGCAIGWGVQNFTADFTQQNVQAQTFGTPPTPQLQFNNPAVQANANMINGVWSGCTTQGSFGIQFTVLDNLPQSIISLLLGKNIALVTVTIPQLEMAVVAQWGVIVYPFPVVEIFVQISAGVIVDIGEIVYYSNGIRDAIETGCPGKLVNGIGIPTTYPDGSPHWPLRGFIQLEGGVSISVLIFDGGAYVFIRLDAMMGIEDIYKTGYITWDQFVWLVRANGDNVWGALSKKITLSAGFGIYIEACIDLLFTSWCWTIWQDSWSAVIFTKEWDPAVIPQVASATSQLNLGTSLIGVSTGMYLVHDTPECRQINFFPTGVDVASAVGPLSRCVPASYPVTTNGNPTGPTTIQIQNVASSVQLPSSNLLSVNVMADSYPGASSFQISPSLIVPTGVASGVSISQCAGVSVQGILEAPVYTSGAPCAVSLSSNYSSNVTLSGMNI
jgi:hypothetical protein